MSEELVPPLEIPFSSLSADAQESVLDSFIWREGTDYGEREAPLEQKRQQLRAQIAKKEIKLVFDPQTESVTLILARELRS